MGGVSARGAAYRGERCWDHGIPTLVSLQNLEQAPLTARRLGLLRLFLPPPLSLQLFLHRLPFSVARVARWWRAWMSCDRGCGHGFTASDFDGTGGDKARCHSVDRLIDWSLWQWLDVSCHVPPSLLGVGWYPGRWCAVGSRVRICSPQGVHQWLMSSTRPFPLAHGEHRGGYRIKPLLLSYFCN